MKPIKLLAATVISLASLSAQAAFFTLDSANSTPIPSGTSIGANAFLGNLNGLTAYNLGGNLKSAVTGTFDIKFTFLAKEANYTNYFETADYSINSTSDTPLFDLLTSTVNASPTTFTQRYELEDDKYFNFKFRSFQGGGSVTNEFNTTNPSSPSFATLLLPGILFENNPFDAILFFDDVGSKDDNHDDLVIGLTVSAVPVPEPSSIALLMAGMVGMFAARRRLKA
jgi:hypothetical protein